MIEAEKKIISEQINMIICEIESKNFESFTNERPYIWDTKNKIFFTYSDCYRANCPTYISFEELHHPHKNCEDRGYIKGVATDLNGWLFVKNSNINYTLNFELYAPKIRKSKKSEIYKEYVNIILQGSITHWNTILENEKKRIAKAFKDVTGCSLNYYL